MAMTSGPDPVLLRGMLELRAEADRRWAQVAPRVRARALRVGGRRDGPAVAVRGRAPGGPVTVAGAVLVAELAAAVRKVPGAELDDLLLDLAAGDPADLRGVTLVVTAVPAPAPVPGSAPEPLPDTASRLRRVVAGRLREILGPVLPEPVEDAVRVWFGDLAAPPGPAAR